MVCAECSLALSPDTGIWQNTRDRPAILPSWLKVTFDVLRTRAQAPGGMRYRDINGDGLESCAVSVSQLALLATN